MKNINFYLIIILFSFFFILSSERNDHDSFLFSDISDIGNSLEIEFIKHGELYLKNNNFVIKKIDIELAYKEIDKRNGLKYRSFLKEDRGMLFVLNDQEEYKKINMENMRIPLDIVYVNQLNVVVFVDQYVSPIEKFEIINLPSDIKYVLEINAGMSNKWGIKNGITKMIWNLNKE
ncbi:DUF192 domain-containing protein [Blattabacterium cuenoti]|uniref:DUF192 domain-containing protein n=1 Tax=Blattabacterium cuenoti TaxID=1653831 RepID=UPI00163C0200|nr:DUF192 domain-containing protein [Blattabacterium cuenoti]